MGSIIKRQGKRGPLYYYKFIDLNGFQRMWAAGNRRKDAEAYKLHIDRQLAEGNFEKQQDIHFTDFSRKWLSNYAAIKVKPRTYDDYEQVIRIHLQPFFGKSLLRNISPRHVQSYIADKMQEGLSPRTVNKSITVLKMMMNHAIRWGFLGESPARFAERPRQPRKEMDFLGSDEVRRFLVAASPEYHALFATAVLTGARQGEILAIRRGNVDLEKRIIYIRRTYHPKHGFSEPKTKSSERPIVISSKLERTITRHLANTEGDPGDLLFRNRAGGPINHRNMMTREFYPALNRAGVRRIRFHDLRHTYAALMISLGENIKFIQKQLGHASLTTTMDTYGHLLPEVSKGFGDRLDSLVYPKKNGSEGKNNEGQSLFSIVDGISGG
ncbi:MAG: site-specific integrase [Actinobacteria bacterium]|nr:site-specific integrase [Actinomycetota bacterium]MCG2819694.1 site-specific integrase [Actinomycetes bacterium]